MRINDAFFQKGKDFPNGQEAQRRIPLNKRCGKYCGIFFIQSKIGLPPFDQSGLVVEFEKGVPNILTIASTGLFRFRL